MDDRGDTFFRGTSFGGYISGRVIRPIVKRLNNRKLGVSLVLFADIPLKGSLGNLKMCQRCQRQASRA